MTTPSTVWIGPMLLRVVRCLPSAADACVHTDVQWAGVGQAPREETAGCCEGVEVDPMAMGI